MPAVPKRKISRTRGAKRRAHWALKTAQFVRCEQCGAPKRPHRVCLACGTYRGVQVIKVEED